MYLKQYKSAFYSLLLNSAGSLSALLLEIFISNNLTQNDYGYFRYIYTVAFIASTFASIGTSQYGIKVAAKYSVGRRLNHEVTSIVQNVLAGFTIVCVVTSGLLYIGVLKAEGSIWLFLSIIFFWCFIRALFIITRALALGLGKYVPAQISDRLTLNLVPLALAIVFVLFGFQLSLQHILYFSLIGTIISFLVVLYAVSGHIKPSTKSLFKAAPKNIANRFSRLIYICLGEGADCFLRLGIIIILGMSMSFSEVAIFAVLIRLTDSLGMVQTAANAVYTKKIIGELASFKDRGYLPSTHNCALFTSIFIGFALVVVIIAGKYFLALFGNSYQHYSWALQMMVGCMLIKAILGPSNTVLTMTNNSKSNFYINFIFAMILAICAYFGSLKYGISGAIFSYAVISVLQSVISSINCRMKTGIYCGIVLKAQRRSLQNYLN